jgi:WS/DGAT/MGAT family acyltransferase
MRGPVDQLRTDDLVQLAAEVGPVRQQVGCVLVLDGTTCTEPEALAELVAQRLGSVPRFRQVLVPAPPACGPALWVDDPESDPRRHVHVVACPGDGGERALLDAVRDVTVAPLSLRAPPWRAVVLTGLSGGRLAVVLVVRHVLTDGVGGLAVLSALVDDPAPQPRRLADTRWVPRRRPRAATVARAVWSARLRALPTVPARVTEMRRGLTTMRQLDRTRTSRSSLNVRTGPRRRVVVARADLAALHAAARSLDATVNDVVLAAVSGALRELVVRRGEPTPQMTASVPVSRRRTATAGQLGNSLSGMVVPLSTTVDRRDRLRRTAAATRTLKAVSMRPFEALVGPMFRLFARLHLTRAFVDHQRMVTTFVSDLAGPTQVVTVGGATVLEMLPVSHTTGNVTTTFAALSYAGRLAVAATVDADACHDAELLGGLVQVELDGYVELGACVSPREVGPPRARSSGTPR